MEPDDTLLIQAIDSLVQETYPPAEPGAAVLVARDGEIIFRKGQGMAHLELGVPIEPDMVFRLGSITKQFTAVAILMLAEQGKLALDDPLTRFLPDYPMEILARELGVSPEEITRHGGHSRLLTGATKEPWLGGEEA